MSQPNCVVRRTGTGCDNEGHFLVNPMRFKVLGVSPIRKKILSISAISFFYTCGGNSETIQDQWLGVFREARAGTRKAMLMLGPASRSACATIRVKYAKSSLSPQNPSGACNDPGTGSVRRLDGTPPVQSKTGKKTCFE